MNILTFKTDQPEARIALFSNSEIVEEASWQAHKQLSVTLHKKIEELLDSHKLSWQKIEGIVVFQGPGSFTGLRIGVTVANTLSDSLQVPIVASKGDDWEINGISKILKGENEKLVLPEYGGEANITKPRK